MFKIPHTPAAIRNDLYLVLRLGTRKDNLIIV